MILSIRNVYGLHRFSPAIFVAQKEPRFSFFFRFFLVGYFVFLATSSSAQAVAPRIGNLGCKLNGNVYWAISGNFPNTNTTGGITYYHYIDSGPYTVLADWNCYQFDNAPPNNGCSINGTIGTRGTFSYNPTNCSIDSSIGLLFMAIALYLTYLYYSGNLKLVSLRVKARQLRMYFRTLCCYRLSDPSDKIIAKKLNNV